MASGGPADGSLGMAAADDLYQRVLRSTDVSFTLADPYQPDTPLTWVNDAFTRIT